MSFSENKKLLADVLEDANYQAFKSETEMLAQAELRRIHRRIVPIWLPLAASVLLAMALLYRFANRRSTETSVAAEPDLVRVATIPLALSETIQSTAELRDIVVTTSDRTVEFVVTESDRMIPEATDTELLARISEQPGGGGFVQVGNQRKVVIFY